MKRTYIKKALAEVFKALDQNGYKNCEIMELSLKTRIDKEAALFVRADAIINMPGEEGKKFQVQERFRPMSNHCIDVICPVCGEEYDARLWMGCCPKCGHDYAEKLSL